MKEHAFHPKCSFSQSSSSRTLILHRYLGENQLIVFPFDMMVSAASSPATFSHMALNFAGKHERRCHGGRLANVRSILDIGPSPLLRRETRVRHSTRRTIPLETRTSTRATKSQSCQIGVPGATIRGPLSWKLNHPRNLNDESLPLVTSAVARTLCSANGKKLERYIIHTEEGRD